MYWAASGGSEGCLRVFTSHFDDDMTPVSIDMRKGRRGRVDMWRKCGGAPSRVGGHRYYMRKFNGGALTITPEECPVGSTRSWGMIYRVCCEVRRKTSEGVQIREVLSWRLACGRASIRMECGVARPGQWSTQVGCPRRASPGTARRRSNRGEIKKRGLRAIS